ncbi:hypothetical protein GIB67_037006, partial [Kingdonia uniflora]
MNKVHIMAEESGSVYDKWEKAIVCGMVDHVMSWHEVGKVILKAIGKEDVTLFLFVKVKHCSLYRLWRRIQRFQNWGFYERMVGRWWFIHGDLKLIVLLITSCGKTVWIRVLGVPVHLWRCEIFNVVGECCEGLIEAHLDSFTLRDLSTICLEVRGGRGNYMPKRIPILDHGGIIATVVELDNDGGGPLTTISKVSIERMTDSLAISRARKVKPLAVLEDGMFIPCGGYGGDAEEVKVLVEEQSWGGITILPALTRLKPKVIDEAKYLEARTYGTLNLLLKYTLEDSCERFQGCYYAGTSPSTTVLIHELQDIENTIKIALDWGCEKLIVNTDSNHSQQLTSDLEPPWRARRLISRIINDMSQFQSCEIKHAFTATNKGSDHLTKLKPDEEYRQIYPWDMEKCLTQKKHTGRASNGPPRLQLGYPETNVRGLDPRSFGPLVEDVPQSNKYFETIRTDVPPSNVPNIPQSNVHRSNEPRLTNVPQSNEPFGTIPTNAPLSNEPCILQSNVHLLNEPMLTNVHLSNKLMLTNIPLSIELELIIGQIEPS